MVDRQLRIHRPCEEQGQVHGAQRKWGCRQGFSKWNDLTESERLAAHRHDLRIHDLRRPLRERNASSPELKRSSSAPIAGIASTAKPHGNVAEASIMNALNISGLR